MCWSPDRAERDGEMENKTDYNNYLHLIITTRTIPPTLTAAPALIYNLIAESKRICREIINFGLRVDIFMTLEEGTVQ